MKKIEVAHRQELEIKIKTRMTNASEFLRVIHDREVNKAVCKMCKKDGFDTWDEMQAHVRRHLMLDIDLNDPKAAGTAQRVAADMDKLMYPQYKMSMRQKRMGILPPDEDEQEVAARVMKRVGS